jgi:hypothetical protein
MAAPLALQYEKVADYHVALRKGDPAKVSKRGKSTCAAELTLQVAQTMLDTGYRDDLLPSGYPQRVFARWAGVWYRALPHGPGRYHGSPVAEQIVPPDARKVMQARWVR